MNRCPSDYYMQKSVGEGMWKSQDEDGWMKLTQILEE
jgi:hypothetical protein